jgi:hypothetical protein
MNIIKALCPLFLIILLTPIKLLSMEETASIKPNPILTFLDNTKPIFENCDEEIFFKQLCDTLSTQNSIEIIVNFVKSVELALFKIENIRNKTIIKKNPNPGLGLGFEAISRLRKQAFIQLRTHFFQKATPTDVAFGNKRVTSIISGLLPEQFRLTIQDYLNVEKYATYDPLFVHDFLCLQTEKKIESETRADREKQRALLASINHAVQLPKNMQAYKAELVTILKYGLENYEREIEEEKKAQVEIEANKQGSKLKGLTQVHSLVDNLAQKYKTLYQNRSFLSFFYKQQPNLKLIEKFRNNINQPIAIDKEISPRTSYFTPPDPSQKPGMQPLHYAVYLDHGFGASLTSVNATDPLAPLIQALVANGADINAVINNPNSVIATEKEELENEKGETIPIQPFVQPYAIFMHLIHQNYAPLHGMTPLHIAIVLNHFWCIKTLLKLGADLNKTVDSPGARLDGLKPIHLASIFSRPNAMRILAAAGTNVNEPVEKEGAYYNGATPLLLALTHRRDFLGKRSNIQATLTLRKLGAKIGINEQDLWDAFVEMNIGSGFSALMHRLVQGGHLNPYISGQEKATGMYY